MIDGARSGVSLARRSQRHERAGCVAFLASLLSREEEQAVAYLVADADDDGDDAGLFAVVVASGVASA